MIPTPLSGRAWPRPWRGVPGLLVVSLAVLLGAAAPRPSSRTPLSAGFTTEREIHGGEVHAYPVDLRAGQFLRVSVQEKGIGLVVRLTDSSHKDLTGVDGVMGGESKEDLAFVAPAQGTYELKVVSAEENAGAGRYVLKVGALRQPQGKDRLRADAVRAAWAGQTPGMAAQDQVRAFENALALWQRLGDARQTAEVLFYLGYLKKEKLSMFDLAAADIRRSAALLEQQPDRGAKKLRAFALTYLGRSLSQAGHRAEARAAHERALAQARAIHDPEFQATNLNILGKSDIADGEVKKGFGRLQKALPLARQAKNQQLEAIILNNLADAYEHLSEMQKALALYDRALQIALALKDAHGEMIYVNNLGEAHRYLGDWEKALDYYRRAAKLSEKDKDIRGIILINLAGAYQHLGRLTEARRTYDQALDVGRQTKSQMVQCFALGNRALLRLQSKQLVEALDDAKKAVGLSNSLEAENFSRLVLGKALREAGDKAAAKIQLDKALALARTRGAQGTEAEIDLALARIAKDRDDLAAARSHVDDAIGLIESRRGRIVDPELRTSLLAAKHDYYEFKIGILMALHAQQPSGSFAADALQVSEQARARGLLEILNEAWAEIGQGADAALLKKERRLRGELNARDWQRHDVLAKDKPDPKKVTEVEHQLEQARDAYQRVQVELRESNPAYAALTQPQPLDVTEIQRQLLDGRALLLEYSLGAEGSFLWAVTPGSVQSFQLPHRDRIEKVARRYYARLTARNLQLKGEDLPAYKQRIATADAEAEQAARELSQLVLQPVWKLLADRPLLIVADGALQYIPFAALPIPGTGAPLANRHQILSLPSASVLAVIRRELRGRSPAPKRLAIFSDPVFQKDDERLLPNLDKTRRGRLSQATSPRRGAPEDGRKAVIDLTKFPRLKASQREAKTIAELLPQDQVFNAEGFDASRAAVTNGELYKYRDVHFATHGVLDSDHPELSGLVLSLYNRRGEFQRDGFLRLNDVYNLRLNADLVVLSACQTALGKEIRGEGLVGLTRGFMYAGATRVLASLWSVEDRATAELMGSFYRGMLREGLSPAAALRKAQLEIARKPAWKSPYYWAGFSLQGEWR